MVRFLGRWACVALAWGLLAFAGGGAWAQLPTGKLAEPQIGGPLGTKFHNPDTAKRFSDLVAEFGQARSRCDVRAMDAALAKLATLAGQLPPFAPGQMVKIPPGAPQYSEPEARSADGGMVRSMVEHLGGLRKDLLDCFKTPPFRAAAQQSLAAADAAIKKCDLEAYEKAITDLNTESARLRSAALRRQGEFKDASDEARNEALREADRLRNLSRHLSAQKAAAFKDCKKPTRVGQAAPARPATPRPAATPQQPRPTGGLGGASTGGIGALIFEVGGFDVSSALGSVDCPAPGCGGGSSGSQNTSANSGFFGADLRLNLFGLLSVLNLGVLPIPISENVIFTGPFAGLRLRRYFDYNGNVIAFDFHPAAGTNDTSLSYEAFWNAKFYLGLGFAITNPGFAPFLAAIGVSAYVGLVTEKGRLRMATDESLGGGVANVFQRDLTRNGTAFGLDVDFFPRQLPFFIGLGLQWDKMNETTISGTSAINGFAYVGKLPGQTNFSTAVRIGVPLNPGVVSDSRLKRDVTLLERRSDGIGLYRYRYLWSDTAYVGVMAQEVEKLAPEAVVRGVDGFLRVRYDRLGLAMTTWKDWQANRTATHAAR